jgi:hypothetical protein
LVPAFDACTDGSRVNRTAAHPRIPKTNIRRRDITCLPFFGIVRPAWSPPGRLVDFANNNGCRYTCMQLSSGFSRNVSDFPGAPRGRAHGGEAPALPFDAGTL